MNGLVVFPTFFNLSLNFAVRSSWSEPQTAPGLIFTDYIELIHPWVEEHNQSNFSIDHLVMSMCRVISCVVGRGCLLWPVHSLCKTLLAFALLYFVLQGQTCLLLQVSHSIPLWWKGHLFLFMLVLEGLVGLHRTVNFSFFGISGWGIDMDYSYVKCFA